MDDQEPCLSCIEAHQCPLPRRVRNYVECMRGPCYNDCEVNRGGFYDKSCEICRIENCEVDKRQYALLNKLTGYREEMDIAAGDQAYRRCVIHMCEDCYNGWVLYGNNDDLEIRCEKCINRYCRHANNDFTCISAGQELGRISFCSNVSYCRGETNLPVEDYTCPDDTLCCQYVE